MKKIVALFLALSMLCAMALAEVPEGYPEVIEGLDFGGMNVVLYDYWSGPNERVAEPDEQTQATYDYQDWLMETYNFTYKQMQGGDWGSQAQEIINFQSTPDGTYRLYILPPDFVGTPMANNVFAAWPSNVDLTAEKWNSSTVNFMSKGGNVYGVATGNSEPRQCLYFNKRVLKEAGIDWNTVYDLQAEGKWTWEAFETMLKQIQKDVDNDGVIDIYGMTGSNVDMYRVAVFANNGKFFDFDADGKLVIAANSDETLEALAWSKDIFNTYFYQQPADGSWDYYKDAWKQGFCGFYMYQTYGGFNDNSEMADMDDEWGCVAFPVGPKGTTYVNIVSDNVTVIPNAGYTAEEMEKIAKIYDLMTDPTPGFDDEDAWIGNKYNYTDDRAVDETYAMLRMPEHCVADAVLYIGSINDVEGSDYLWNLASATPAELYEAKAPVWQALCDIFNGVSAQ